MGAEAAVLPGEVNSAGRVYRGRRQAVTTAHVARHLVKADRGDARRLAPACASVGGRKRHEAADAEEGHDHLAIGLDKGLAAEPRWATGGCYGHRPRGAAVTRGAHDDRVAV